MKILGIETSCDETAAAVISVEKPAQKVKILSNIVSSQIKIHKKYGGVIPEVAAREHVLNIIPVIDKALAGAGLSIKKLAEKKEKGLDAIAVTVGPGLITSLQVGVETAKTISYAWKIPDIAVNHIEGHIYANFIDGRQKINFPAIILTVSGGHTMLVLMENHGKYKTIGQTRDDAAGEAFDKAAKLMGLGYPGGPAISAMAEKSKILNLKSKIILPRPMINKGGFDFSFSGLKTALRYELEKNQNYHSLIPTYCHEFQQAIIDVLIKKAAKAAKKYQAKSIMLTGGVAANKKLRQQMAKTIKKDFPKIAFFVPDLKYTTDNAVMIAMAGYCKAKRKEFTPWQSLKTNPNLEL